MKRRLITSLYLSLAALSACQAEPAADTDTVDQAVSSSCGAQMPDLPAWKGERLPPTSENQIYLFYTDVERRGEMDVVLVDYGKGAVLFGYRATTSQGGALMSSLGNAAQFAGGAIPVPPKPVLPGWSLPAALITWAQNVAPIHDLAGKGGVCAE
jgi:hypothetical protein